MKFLPLSAALILGLTGCASISVKDTQHAGRTPGRPAVIQVADFDTSGGNWKITSISRKPEQYKAEVAALLTKELVADLHAFLQVPVQAVGHAKTPPPNGWLVTGKFTRVSEGNPAGRILVGLGLGSSKLETQTVVYDGRTRGPFLSFATTGGSNAVPGMLLSSGPGSAAFTAVTQAMRGVNDDTKRTSRMITASLVEVGESKGWIKGSELKVKRPGEYQLIQPVFRPKVQ